MKLSHLLTGAALVALTAGAAQAQYLTIGNFDGNAGNDDATAQIVFASELDLSAEKPAGFFEFQLDLRDISAAAGSQGAFDGLGASTPATITFTLTNSQFTSGVAAGSYVGGEGTAPAITSGGAASDTSITYTIASNTNNYDDAVDDLEFRFPVTILGNGANLSVTVASGGSTLYSETFDAIPATTAQDTWSASCLVTRLPCPAPT